MRGPGGGRRRGGSRPRSAMGCSRSGAQLHGNAEGERQRTGEGRKQTGETTTRMKDQAPGHEERTMKTVLKPRAQHRNTNQEAGCRTRQTAQPRLRSDTLYRGAEGGGPPLGRKHISVSPIAGCGGFGGFGSLLPPCLAGNQVPDCLPCKAGLPPRWKLNQRQRPTGNNGLRPSQESSPLIKIPAPVR